MGDHVLDQERFWHRGREYTLGELTPDMREQIREEMRADLVAVEGEEYVAALEARIAEVVAKEPLFRRTRGEEE